MSSVSTSTIVEMNGLAITAGSRCSRSASRGSRQPAAFAQMTVNTIVTQMTSATSGVTPSLPSSSRSTTISFTKLQAASVTPHSTATRISFQMTRKASEHSTSPSDRPRMTATDACVPLLPPVPVSIGMNAISAEHAAREFSYPVSTMLVSVADSIRISSHGKRAFHVSKTPVRR